jgi:hypothetical protein
VLITTQLAESVDRSSTKLDSLAELSDQLRSIHGFLTGRLAVATRFEGAFGGLTDVGVGVAVGLAVAVAVALGVALGVGLPVAVGVGLAEAVGVGVTVGVEVAVAVGVLVGEPPGALP